ncbi:MAG: peptidoglycan-associated lipoprotein Pal [Nitrospiraceae bacterium]
MRSSFATSVQRLLLGVVAVGLIAGCSGKKISTGVGDQSTVPGPQAAAPPPPILEIAPEAPPPPSISQPTPPPAMEPPPAPPTVAEPAPVPPAPPVVAEAVAPPPPPVEPAPLPQIAQAPVAKPIEPPPAVEPSGSLQDVYFDFDQSGLRQDARTTLEENAKLLRNNTNGKILIEGHCDERGTSAYNLILGEQRAKSVKRYLENLGVSASQLQIVSYGKERPFCREHNDACWQSNRRAHFVIK